MKIELCNKTDDCLLIYSVNYNLKKSWWKLLIKNVPIDVKIDTGAETNLLHYDAVKKLII